MRGKKYGKVRPIQTAGGKRNFFYVYLNIKQFDALKFL